ncbi:hypothetical protein CIB48_g9705 [Xylaria polymorpha]|nr:hypothetical protein CIB48_g9705 [Xylaria polymorpha]
MSAPVIQLAGLQTDDRNARTANIDRVSTVELCYILNREDHEVPLVVEQRIPVIAEVIDALSERVRNGGRIFYIGAGTSGRCPGCIRDTPDVLGAIGLIHSTNSRQRLCSPLSQGGSRGWQDRGRDRFARIQPRPEGRLVNLDRIIWPYAVYVLGGLSYVRLLGATTVALVCVSPSAAGIEGNADYLISAVSYI